MSLYQWKRAYIIYLKRHRSDNNYFINIKLLILNIYILVGKKGLSQHIDKIVVPVRVLNLDNTLNCSIGPFKRSNSDLMIVFIFSTVV